VPSIMLTQMTNALFPEGEDTIWDSTGLFHSDADASSSSTASSEPFPLLLSNPTIRPGDRRELTLNTAPVPPPIDLTRLSWSTAAQDAAEGVHYVRERFPGENVTYLSQPFRQAPIQVEVDDKVLVLDEISEYAIRVRLLRNGSEGIMPSWDVEDPLERLARMNMEFNEIVSTSPARTAHLYVLIPRR
jgi:hypothetical protein